MIELKVVGDVAKLLFDLSCGLEISGTVQGVSTAGEEGDEVAGDVATCNVKTAGEVVENDGFVDWDDMSYSVTGVNNDTR